MFKRLVERAAPDATRLREAIKAANGHLDYIEYLLDHRRWLAGPAFSLADIAAAAQLSIADYMGGIDWRGHAQAVQWYSALTSRPTFRRTQERRGGQECVRSCRSRWSPNNEKKKKRH